MKQKKLPQVLPLETAIGGSADEHTIKQAVEAYVNGLIEFLFPKSLVKHETLSQFLSIKEIVTQRIESVLPLTTEVIIEINERSHLLNSAEYTQLLKQERALWTEGEDTNLAFGVKTCVDQGVPREAIAGDGHVGRTLAGDDEINYVPAKGQFTFKPSTFVKRIRHAGRMGEKVVLEALVEHLGCGRRGQMIANWNADNKYARLIRVVTDHLAALGQEFNTSDKKYLQIINNIFVNSSSGLPMSHDGGVWLGIILKIAQRQAYRHLDDSVRMICPIEVYDKFNGDMLSGFDQLEALTHPIVSETGGFTQKALGILIEKNIIFSLKYEIEHIEKIFSQKGKSLNSELSVPQGKHTFADLQTQWFEVKKQFVAVTSAFWSMYENPDRIYDPIRHMARKFLEISLSQIDHDLDDLPSNSHIISRRLIERRLIHQLFRSASYAWVLDTFNRGNPPGNHIENHLATGDSAVLGVKRNLPLGQGDMNPPSADEFFTGRSVLMHSVPGHDGKPLLVFLKLDTERDDHLPMSTEETQRAIDDFREFLRLWPYFIAGDMVPIIVIRGKHHGGVSRLGLSVLKAFGDLVDAYADERLLPELVWATNSKGEVVKVSSLDLIKAAIVSGKELKVFRSAVEKLADTVSDHAYQRRFGQ